MFEIINNKSVCKLIRASFILNSVTTNGDFAKFTRIVLSFTPLIDVITDIFPYY